MKKTLLSVLIIVWSVSTAQTSELVFVHFKDKPNAAAFFENPASELSPKALSRRSALNIPLDLRDAPIETSYLQSIAALGFDIKDASKWLNGVAVKATAAQISALEQQPYVAGVESFVKNRNGKIGPHQSKFDNELEAKTNFNYGSADAQISQINLKPLHLQGKTGVGISIAVIDTGYPTVNTGSSFARIRNNGQIKGGYNFVQKNNNIYGYDLNSHGTLCLSAIAGYLENAFAGSGPDADFYLYVSEDEAREIPEEEIYWIQAAEQADRVGVDIISTSLGYNTFDDSRYNYTYSQMDGKTAFISRGAQIASEKGIIVVAAAGNEGMKPWKYITAPADNAEVFSVGAITSTGAPSSFTSYGPNASGVIKPDAAARGTDVALTYGNNTTVSSGTSFATPLAAGAIASLLQALPANTSRVAIKTLLRTSASLYPSSDNRIGFGILNMEKALQNANLSVSEQSKSSLSVVPNPTTGLTQIISAEPVRSVKVYSVDGRLLKSTKNKQSIDISGQPDGTYLLKVETADATQALKIIKK